MKKWYTSKTIIVAVLQGLLGVIVAVSSEFDVAYLLTAKSVIDIILRTITTAPIKK